jgi:hypothetical protein
MLDILLGAGQEALTHGHLRYSFLCHAVFKASGQYRKGN